MVMIVLLNDAWICAMPSEMFFLTFLRVRVTVLVGACAIRLVSLCPQILDRRLLGRRLGRGRDGRRLGGTARRRRLPRLLRSLACPCVGTRTLTANRQSLAVAHASVAAEVHQPLDAHGYLAAQVSLDRVPADELAQLVHLRVGQVLDLGRVADVGGLADHARAWTPDAVNRGQRDFGMLVIRNVDACNTGHVITLSFVSVSLAAACGGDPCKSLARH